MKATPDVFFFRRFLLDSCSAFRLSTTPENVQKQLPGPGGEPGPWKPNIPSIKSWKMQNADFVFLQLSRNLVSDGERETVYID